MAASAFTRFAFQRALKAGDSSRFGVDLKKDKSDYIDQAIVCSRDPKSILNFNDLIANGKPCVSYSDYPTTLVLRALANNLNYKNAVRMPDRDQIVRAVKQTISDATPMAIHRRDIKSFYESIPLDNLRRDLLSTALLSPRARNVLQQYFKVHCDGKEFGVPRGLPVSASLAEIAMQRYDDEVVAQPGVYRYFRFSDDILIFTYDTALDIDAVLGRVFPPSFVLNSEKSSTQVISGADFQQFPYKSFEYLGYDFHVYNGPIKRSDPRPFSVSIATNKLRKLKTRIIISLKKFRSDKDASLLVDRLRFLSSNYRVSRGRINVRAPKRKVRSGLYFNYRHCCDASAEFKLPKNADALKRLDGFLHALLWSTNSEFENAVRLVCTSAQKTKLRRISFFHGFANSLMRRFRPTRIREIKSAWAYAR